MAKKKSAAKKKIAKKTSSKTSARSTTRAKNTKFHGVIEVEPPAQGKPIADGKRVLVAIRRIAFGDLPDLGSQNDLSLVVAVETDKPDKPDNASTEQASASFKVELLKYVKDDESLNTTDLVIFSGPVHRYLTLRCSVDELDAKSIEPTKQLIAAALGLGKELAGAGTAKTLLGGLPALFGALLSFNDDDQVLVLNHSFYTESVSAGQNRLLQAGLYTFRKQHNPPLPKPQVEVEVEVLAVEHSTRT